MSQFGVMRAPATIVFGDGQRMSLLQHVQAAGRNVLICTDERLSADPTFAGMIDSLTRGGLSVSVYDGTQAELPLACVHDSIAAAKACGAEAIVGMGGGSCLDIAKLTALMTTFGGEAQDYYGEFKVPGPTLPVIAIPTTAGTGSEVTPVAVIEDPGKVTKIGISSPHLIPRVAICDPELTHSCPPSLTASAGADALTHAVEAFTAITLEPTPTLATDRVFVGKNAFSDHFALSAIALIVRSLERAYRNGGDAAARSDVMLGSLYAGLAFGTAGTAAAHAIQYPVGAVTHTPHGVGVATLLPYVMQYNRSHSTKPFADIARAIGAGAQGASEDALADTAIAAIARLLDAVGIPSSLAGLGVKEDDMPWISQQSMASERLVRNNPRPLDAEAMERITKAAFAGDRSLLEPETTAGMQ